MKMLKQLYFGLLITVLLLPPSHAAEGFWEWLFSFERKKGVEAVIDASYEEECGACHFPYQPGLLPAASWARLMDKNALADHFGDNAELDEQTRSHIAKFLEENSAEKSYYKRSRKIMASLDAGEAPIRITEVPYIKEKHEEIPAKLIKENSQVKSLSACQKCHQKASEGVYDDDTVLIPGHGRW